MGDSDFDTVFAKCWMQAATSPKHKNEGHPILDGAQEVGHPPNEMGTLGYLGHPPVTEACRRHTPGVKGWAGLP